MYAEYYYKEFNINQLGFALKKYLGHYWQKTVHTIYE